MKFFKKLWLKLKNKYKKVQREKNKFHCSKAFKKTVMITLDEEIANFNKIQKQFKKRVTFAKAMKQDCMRQNAEKLHATIFKEDPDYYDELIRIYKEMGGKNVRKK